jgi:hypothetical protein
MATLMYYNIVTFERAIENIGDDIDVCYLHNTRQSGENVYLAPAGFDPADHYLSGIAIMCAIKEITYAFTVKPDECIKINKVEKTLVVILKQR